MWSHISRQEENMEKKSAKNCTLYHVVNKSVWADIGAASTSSTNILVLLVLAASIGKDTQTFYNLKNFADFLHVCSAHILVLTGLQHQYIGAVQGEQNCLQLYSSYVALFYRKRLPQQNGDRRKRNLHAFQVYVGQGWVLAPPPPPHTR